MRASGTELIDGAGDLADFEEGHSDWKEAQGGVFTISLREIVDVMEKAVNSVKD